MNSTKSEKIYCIVKIVTILLYITQQKFSTQENHTACIIHTAVRVQFTNK